MGAELAKLSAHYHAGVDGNAFKVLNRMAWTALDRQNPDGRPPRLYFGGWGPLALAMGFNLPADDDDSPDAQRTRRRLQKYVATAVRKLVEAGAIDPVHERAGFGTRQTYRLLVGLTAPHSMGINSPPLSGVLGTPPDGMQQQPTEYVSSLPSSGGPRKQQDLTEDLDQDRTTCSDLSSHPSREAGQTMKDTILSQTRKQLRNNQPTVAQGKLRVEPREAVG